jgi:VWFA-related protein
MTSEAHRDDRRSHQGRGASRSGRPRRVLRYMTVIAALAGVTVAGDSSRFRADVDLVELDVVAFDRDDRPVTDLRQDEFRIKEDGHLVAVKTFAQVAALGSLQPDDGRIVVLLMDDIGVPMSGTSPMQQIGPILLSPFGQGDELSVIRLSSRSDEPFGDLKTVRERIEGYRGGVQPFSTRDTPETVLKALARISRQLEQIDHRRKVIICLGLPSVCDVSEPALGGASALWQPWVAAITSMARANVALYCVDPTGTRGGLNLSGSGLVDLAGGRIFAHANTFGPAAEAIWREAGHYYLLGYWPAASTREVHSIDVSIARKGVKVRARQRR